MTEFLMLLSSTLSVIWSLFVLLLLERINTNIKQANRYLDWMARK